MTRRTLLSIPVMILCGLAHAAEVEIAWEITGSGTGPGGVWTSAPLVRVWVTPESYCYKCDLGSSGYVPSCSVVGGDIANGEVLAVFLDDLWAPPGNDNNLVLAFSGAEHIRTAGGFCWIAPGWMYWACYQIPGAKDLITWTWPARLASGDWWVAPTFARKVAGPHPCLCGFGIPGPGGGWLCQGCNVSTHHVCGPAGYQEASASAQYLKKSPNAPFECTKTGTGAIEADGNWHFVADVRQNTCAGGQCKGQPLPQCCPCVAPNADTVYSALIPSQSPTGYEVKAVMASVTAFAGDEYSGPDGPYLLVKAEPACETCSKDVATLKQCKSDWGSQCLGNPPCWDKEYVFFGSTLYKESIANKGCAITCAAMTLGTSPSTLNAKYAGTAIDKSTGDINFFKIIQGEGKEYAWYEAKDLLEGAIRDELCKPENKSRGIILKVPSINEGPQHYIVLTGYKDLGEDGCGFAVADPACGTQYPDSPLADFKAVWAVGVRDK